MPRRAILRELIFRWFYGRPIFLKPFLVSRYQGSHLELPVKKWKVTESDYDAVINILRDPVTAPTVVPLNTDNADASKLIARADVPDLPDRIIAATARHSGLPFVTRDSRIQASGIPTIWQGFLYFLPSFKPISNAKSSTGRAREIFNSSRTQYNNLPCFNVEREARLSVSSSTFGNHLFYGG